MKKYIIYILISLTIVFLGIGISILIWSSGNYPVGLNTMEYIHKSEVLFDKIKSGNLFPIYDETWYNGEQMLRFGSPLLIYFFAFCKYISGGSSLNGYLIFISLVFVIGCLSWFLAGIKRKRPLLGLVLGILWFFVPFNIDLLFEKGNLGQVLCIALMPLLILNIYEFLAVGMVSRRKKEKNAFDDVWEGAKNPDAIDEMPDEKEIERKARKIVRNDNWKNICYNLAIYALMVLLDMKFSIMIGISFLIYLFIFRLISRAKALVGKVVLSFLIGFLLTGFWSLPLVLSRVSYVLTSKDMETYFQNYIDTLNPINWFNGQSDLYYFGISIVLMGIFGLLFSKKISRPGFLTAIIIFLLSARGMYNIFSHIGGEEYWKMLKYIPISVAMIFMGFIYWKRLRKWILCLLCILLVVDFAPGIKYLYNEDGKKMSAYERMEKITKDKMFDKARQVTKQRIAFIDEGMDGSMGDYLLTSYDGDVKYQTIGNDNESVVLTENIDLLSDAIEGGWYEYLFDRTKELGDDTILIKKSCIGDNSDDIKSVIEKGKDTGYEFIAENGDYLLLHLKNINGNFGLVTKYNGLGIGVSAPLLSMTYPDMEKGFSDNLNDYTYEMLKKYKLIYIAGFRYDNKEEAEKLLDLVAKTGTKIIINGDGIPPEIVSHNNEFMGVTAHSISFENGYPLLYANEEELDFTLFGSGHSKWETVYFTGLDTSLGYLYENGTNVDFWGTKKDSNIYFIGLNLIYHYNITKDINAKKIIDEMIGDSLLELPDRRLVELNIKFANDELIIKSDEDNVNTTLAYQDCFKSDEIIKSNNNLLLVNKGTSHISMENPYWIQGLVMTAFGFICTTAYIIWLRRKFKVKKYY